MSVYTAELIAIDQTLSTILTLEDDEFIICSESLSSITAIASLDIHHPYVRSILEKCTGLAGRGQLIVFIWCPSHIGIPGNESADSLAKQALTLNITQKPVPYTDLKPYIRSFIKMKWQREWDEESGNK